uniref:Retrotransposon gag domain-containing protein n=1 Tax=Lactuca sativa TaxID=4236 RepID=A0A9R1VVC6_LACSA|nr:hypothetical protein LSAT_V11C400206620 [Lactuca sativa]
MEFPHGMNADEANNIRHDRQIEELQRTTKIITQLLAMLLDAKLRRVNQKHQEDYASGDSIGPDCSSDESGQTSVHKRRFKDDRRDIKVDATEFHGGSNPDGFIEWLNDIKNLLMLRGILMRKKLLKDRFLQDSYKQDLYIKITNFKQGNRIIDDYTREFEQLVLRSGIKEKPEQTMALYVGGLNHDIAEKLELQPFWSFEEVYKLSSKIRKCTRNKKVERENPKSFPKYNNSFQNPFYKENLSKGETSNKTRVEEVNIIEEGEYEMPVYEECYFEERVKPDQGELLVIRRALHAKEVDPNDEQREQIFQSTCMIRGKVRNLIIDNASCTNVASTTLINKLHIPISSHPNPYKLQWLNQGSDVKVAKHALLSFSIGKSYQDQVLCDIIQMDACNMFLGWPWNYNRQVWHNGHQNTYSFVMNMKKVILEPVPSTLLQKKELQMVAQVEKNVFINEARMERAKSNIKYVYVSLLVVNRFEDVPLPVDVCLLLEEFKVVFPSDLPKELPRLRGNEHHIDLILGACFLTNQPTDVTLKRL